MSESEERDLLMSFGEWMLSNDLAYDNFKNPDWGLSSYAGKVDYYIRWRYVNDLPINVSQANKKLKP